MLNVLAGMAFGALICWVSLVSGISLGMKAAERGGASRDKVD